MYLLQIADLHVGSSVQTKPDEDKFILLSAEFLKREIPKGETVLICICGDIIDSKGISGEARDEAKCRYDKALKLIDKFKEKLEDEYRIIVKCCPGNHDATHMDELYDFVKKVDMDYISKAELQSCYSPKIENLETKIIFVNSCEGNQHEKGCIDYGLLEQELKECGKDEKKIIVLHHTVMSMFDDDSSSIRNAAALINLIDKYNVIGVLHGHIHGREILSIGKKHCKVIGTGALFSRENTNINSQFNIIEIKKNIFLKILNCRYHVDGGEEPWDMQEINDTETGNILISNKFSNAYHQLMDRLDVTTPIYNMHMEIENTYKEFCSDLKEFLREDYLKIGDRKWSYFELAKMWQAEKVPEQLYFNHGSYFMAGEKSGIEFVVETLKSKPTSNRIVLPTYNMENVNESLDDKIYLPSLASIQFGKNDDKLIIHMHLRALEAKQFLKINICEIEFLLEQLKEKFVEFDKVKIIVSAFRVQKKERFNCFLKSEIDVMESVNLTTFVNFKNIIELSKLFKEKRDAKETITKIEGIQTVYKAMQASNETITKKSGEKVYNEEIIALLKRALDIYKQLDEIHKSLSIQSEKEELYEKEIDNILGDFIEKLEGLEKKEDTSSKK